MVPMIDCKSAEEVKAMAHLVKARREADVRLRIKEIIKFDYLPQISTAILVREAYPEKYPPKLSQFTNVSVGVADPVKIARIKKAVCEHFKISHEELLATRRTFNTIVPKHIAIALSKKLTLLSYPAIGRLFNRDHSSILHTWRKIGPIIDEINLDGQSIENCIYLLATELERRGYFLNKHKNFKLPVVQL